MNKDTFCSFPFNTIFLGPDAGVKTCCSSRGDIGNLNQTPIVEILQGPLIKEIRSSIINNQWHPQCSQCKELEEKGGRSERTTASNFDMEDFLDATPETFKLQQIDIRWSNVCNLACNYCYEYFSSQWAAIKGIKVNDLKTTNQELLLSFIEDNVDSIITVNLLGGEPLLQKHNSRLIDIVSGKAMYILTNLSSPLETNAIAQKLIAQPYADWGISFETISDKFEYVRHNASWQVFKENLKYLENASPKQINAHALYCNYSAFNLLEYYQFIHDETSIVEIYWTLIDNISQLSPFYLPLELRLDAITEIDNVIAAYEHTRLNTSIPQLIKIKSQLLTEYTSRHNGNFESWTDDIEKQLPKKYEAKLLWPHIYKKL